jgi:hypothetical protein
VRVRGATGRLPLREELLWRIVGGAILADPEAKVPGLSSATKFEGSSIRKIDGRMASWNKARTTAFSRTRQCECRPLTRLGDRQVARPMVGSNAARGPGSPKYDHAPRRLTETVFYAIVRDHVEAFLAHVRESYERALPRYVEQAFRAYLTCGVFAHGFLRPGAGEATQDDSRQETCGPRGGDAVRRLRTVMQPDEARHAGGAGSRRHLWSTKEEERAASQGTRCPRREGPHFA